jgi:hypothetical protein
MGGGGYGAGRGIGGVGMGLGASDMAVPGGGCGCAACLGQGPVGTAATLAAGSAAHVARSVVSLPRNLKNGSANGCRGQVMGPTAGMVQYPYYTTRGPRDFFLANPPSIGP